MRTSCVFTIAKNESVHLPMWVDYYRDQGFDDKDIIVLNHESTDGSTSKLTCRVETVRNPLAFDHYWLKNTVQKWFKALLDDYEFVVFTEADELLWSVVGLKEYVDRLPMSAARSVGYELIHMKDKGELPLDLNKKILEQRQWWFASPAYCKTLIANYPLEWMCGFHHCINAPQVDSDCELLLVHLHRMDYDIALERHKQRTMMVWNPDDLAHGRGKQSLLVGDAFDKWFYQDRNQHELGTKPQPIVEIPEWIREKKPF